jgi:hypothetical protein
LGGGAWTRTRVETKGPRLSRTGPQCAHQSCRRFVQRIDAQAHQRGMNSIKGLVEEQNREIKKVLDDFHLRFHLSEALILRVSKVNVESVHNQLREKLGCYYWNFGQWLRKEYDKWIASYIQTFWVMWLRCVLISFSLEEIVSNDWRKLAVGIGQTYWCKA